MINTLGSPSNLLSVPPLEPEGKGTPTDAALTGHSLREKAKRIDPMLQKDRKFGVDLC